jgi:hypothetical protein
MLQAIFVHAKTASNMSKHLDSNTIVAEIEARIQTLTQEISQATASTQPLASSADLEALERHWQSQTRELADLSVALQMQKAFDNAELRRDSQQLIRRQPRHLRNCGRRLVQIRFVGGTVVALSTVYYARNCDVKKASAKREKGMYPGLYLLGIHDRCTPGLASEIAMASAALCSLEEAREMLTNHGSPLNIKTIRNVVKRFAARARVAQQSDDSEWEADQAAVKKRRVVVSTDGGRVRIRKKKRGPKTRKGYGRYKTDWREPKLFIIYIANDEGRQEKTFCPFLDGTLEGPDAVFGMITYYLGKLKISAADKLLFVADGALWIWDRVKSLLAAWGLKPDQVFELIDFYHAVEHLNEFAKLKPRWSKAQRDSWVKKQRRRLRKGQIEAVLEEVRSASKGTKNALLRRERDYFIKNQARMCYGEVSDAKMPIGSGAMESSIRRVVNMRLKGAGIFWNEDTANEMLMLRCYYKAGRWDGLKKFAFQIAV